MFIEEFASLVLNTVFLFSQLTQLEHFNRRKHFISFLIFVILQIIISKWNEELREFTVKRDEARRHRRESQSQGGGARRKIRARTYKK